jgi:hypothetical protein
MNKTLPASKFLHTQEINSNETLSTKSFYQAEHLGGFGEVFLLRPTEKCSVQSSLEDLARGNKVSSTRKSKGLRPCIIGLD